MAALALGLAGCGGSSATSKSTPVAQTSTNKAAKPTGLALYVEQSGDEPGFVPSGALTNTSSAAVFAGAANPNSSASYTRQLQKSGFVAGAVEAIGGSGGNGISSVIEFKSTAGARTFEASSLRSFLRGAKRFAVPGVPGAYGFGYLGNAAGGTAVNVIWVDGDCYAVIGNAATGAIPVSSLSKPIVHGANTIFDRSRGHCA